jgi:gamma-glutamyltranspeptidase/glutathione hydrolase
MKSFMVVLRPLFRPVLAALAALACTLVNAASVWPVGGEHGMVVTAHQLATKVGVDVLKRGGNAVDAAVAVGYALAVVYPAAGNLGGGGFMTIEMADGRKTFIDFREKAPLAAKPDMYLDSSGNVIKNASTKGHLAVGVPGSVAGFEYAREKYGTRPRSTLIAPAIAFAERGFALDEGDIALLSTATDDSAPILRPPPSPEQGQPCWGGRSPAEGPARTLRLIAQRAPTVLSRLSPMRSPRRRAGNGIISRTIWRSIACASWRRSNAITAATSRVGAAAVLRRRVVRSRTFSRRIRSRTWARPRRRCTTRSRRCGTRISIATPISAIRTS